MVNKMLKKYSELTPVTKASLWFVFCNLMLKGISFFTAPMFTRLLSDEEFGRMSIFLSFQELFITLATWGIQLGTYQRGIYKFKDDIKTYTTATLALTNLLTILFSVLVFAFFPTLRRLTSLPSEIWVFYCIYFFFRPSYDCWLTRKRSAYEYKPAVIVTLAYSLLNVFVPILALLLFGRTAEIKTGAALIVSTCICFLTYFPYANYGKLVKHKSAVKEYWAYTIRFTPPLMLNGLSYFVLGQADRVMIERMVGASQAAYYSVAYNVAMAISVIQNVIDQVAIPWRYQKLEEKNYEDIRRFSNALLILISGMVLLLILVSPDVIVFMFPESYHEAIWCIPPISASIYFIFLYSLFVSFETYYEKTKYVMYVSVTCGILNVLLNYIGIPRYGYIACAYTTLISYVCFAIGHYFFSRKTIRDKVGDIPVFNLKVICGISFALLAASVGITLIYSYIYIRYCIILVFVGLLWFHRHKIASMMEQLKKG